MVVDHFVFMSGDKNIQVSAYIFIYQRYWFQINVVERKVSKYVFPNASGGKWSDYEHENNPYERSIKNNFLAIIVISSTILISTLTSTQLQLQLKSKIKSVSASLLQRIQQNS